METQSIYNSPSPAIAPGYTTNLQEFQQMLDYQMVQLDNLLGSPNLTPTEYRAAYSLMKNEFATSGVIEQALAQGQSTLTENQTMQVAQDLCDAQEVARDHLGMVSTLANSFADLSQWLLLDHSYRHC